MSLKSRAGFTKTLSFQLALMYAAAFTLSGIIAFAAPGRSAGARLPRKKPECGLQFINQSL